MTSQDATAKDRAASARLSLGERVRTLREERGYSRELLAGLAGLSSSGLKVIETGGSWPQMDTSIRLALALGVTMDELVGSPDGYPELRTAAMSFLERRFAQSHPQEATHAGDTAAAGSVHSSRSSKAATRSQSDTAREADATALNAPADKQRRRRGDEGSHVTV